MSKSYVYATQPDDYRTGAAKGKVQILGIRGIPGRHGGFETFAEQLSVFLVEKDWDVTVYCQHVGTGDMWIDYYKNVRRVNIYTKSESAAATIYFDWLSTRLAAKSGEPILTLGYNTAIFSLLYRLKNVPNVINMDGLEWRRKKWSWPAAAWLYLNERLGCLFGNHLVADHPEIGKHLATRVRARKITVIAYGANSVAHTTAGVLDEFDVESDQYGLIIARPEPENSILEIVRAWSARPRGMPLLILGRYVPTSVEFHREVMEAAGSEVRFIGGQYDPAIVGALRVHARIYVHGHQVGGTNPSLVEALGSGSPVLCHDNRFNRWVAGRAGLYFSNEAQCAAAFDKVTDEDFHADTMRVASRLQHSRKFKLNERLGDYEKLLLNWQV